MEQKQQTLALEALLIKTPEKVFAVWAESRLLKEPSNKFVLSEKYVESVKLSGYAKSWNHLYELITQRTYSLTWFRGHFSVAKRPVEQTHDLQYAELKCQK